MSDLPSRRSVHGMGRRRRHRRIADRVSADGPDGRLVRARGSDGLVRAWGFRPVERWLLVATVMVVPVMFVGALWDPQSGDAWQGMLVVFPVQLFMVRGLGISVHADGGVLRIDQGMFRWAVPASAITGVTGTDTGGCLVLRTERREITALAFTHSLGAELTGDRCLLRAAEAVERWSAASIAGGPVTGGEPARERASGWVVLRDAVVLLVVGQALWLVVGALRPPG